MFDRLRAGIEATGATYELAELPEYRDMMITHSPLIDAPINRFNLPPASIEDLVCRVKINRLVTMATPHLGFPGAKALSAFLPCCKDLIPGAESLSQASKAQNIVVQCLVSQNDTLIPVKNQFFDDSKMTLMNGFQHMDFIVGTPEKIAATAEEVLRWLAFSC